MSPTSGQPQRLLGERRVGDHRCSGLQARHQVQLLRGDLPRHHLLLLHQTPASLLHHQPHHPLSPHLFFNSPGLLPALRLRREGTVPAGSVHTPWTLPHLVVLTVLNIFVVMYVVMLLCYNLLSIISSNYNIYSSM